MMTLRTGNTPTCKERNMSIIERNGKFYPTSMTFQELKTMLLAAGIEPRAKVLWKSYDTFIVGLKHLPEKKRMIIGSTCPGRNFRSTGITY